MKGDSTGTLTLHLRGIDEHNEYKMVKVCDFRSFTNTVLSQVWTLKMLSPESWVSGDQIPSLKSPKRTPITRPGSFDGKAAKLRPSRRCDMWVVTN